MVIQLCDTKYKVVSKTAILLLQIGRGVNFVTNLDYVNSMVQ